MRLNKKDLMLVGGMSELVESNRRLASSIENSNYELGKKLDDISKREIKARDRVDISLEEYETLKRERDAMQEEIIRLSGILNTIKIPVSEKIIPNSIKQEVWEDIESIQTVYHISFRCDKRR